MKDENLRDSARTSEALIFTESIFPTAFDTAAMDSYTEQQESYQSIFDDRSKYEAIMRALAGMIYQEMRQ
jgi:type I restriction enzyme R subunit